LPFSICHPGFTTWQPDADRLFLWMLAILTEPPGAANRFETYVDHLVRGRMSGKEDLCPLPLLPYICSDTLGAMVAPTTGRIIYGLCVRAPSVRHKISAEKSDIALHPSWRTQSQRTHSSLDRGRKSFARRPVIVQETNLDFHAGSDRALHRRWRIIDRHKLDYGARARSYRVP